jgi:hypothetical protein
MQDIGCTLSGDGLYNNCSGSAPLVQAMPKVQTNEIAVEIIVTEDVLTDDNVNGVNVGAQVGDVLAGLGQGLSSVIDSINPVDDFMDNIKQVIIIIVVIAVSVIIVIVIIVVVICCIANHKEIWKSAAPIVEKFVDKDVGNQMRRMYDDEEHGYSLKSRREGVHKPPHLSKDDDE